MYRAVLNMVSFLTFSVKHKENNLHTEYKLFGGPAENLSCTISQIEENLWFELIDKSLEPIITGSVFKFCENKI